MARFILFVVAGSILYYVLHLLIRDIPSRTKKQIAKMSLKNLSKIPPAKLTFQNDQP